VLPETDKKEVRKHAERIKAKIERHRFCQDEGLDIS